MRKLAVAVAISLLSAPSLLLSAVQPAQAGRYGGRMTAGDCANLGGRWTPDGTTNGNGTPMGICHN